MASQARQTVGIVFLVLAALMLLGWLAIPNVAGLAAVGVLVAGILMLMHQVKGPAIVAWLLIAFAALLLVPNPVGAWLLDELQGVLHRAVAVLLLVLGLLLLVGKK